MRLADVIEGVSGTRPTWPSMADQPISAVVVDSRRVTPGAVFVAEHTGQRDGHEFLSDALARGASAIIIERHGLQRVTGLSVIDTTSGERPTLVAPVDASPTPVALVVDDTLAALQRFARLWRERMPVRVVGITGSVGKTTTKELVACVLSQRYRTLRNEASLNNEIGLPLTLLRLNDTHERAVLEMGTYGPGEIRALCELAQPHVGVVTIVGASHLERMGSLEVVAQAKAELVEALPADGVAILNGDDPRVRAMADQTRARVFLYGLSPDCNLWADELDSHGLEGISFRAHYARDVLNIRVPLLGLHSVHTALRAIAVGLNDGMGWEEIIAGLQALPGQVRLVAVPGIHGSTLIDDTYNASPESGLAALNLLREMPGRRIAVLGDMLELGEYEAEGHVKVGCRAAEVADVLVAVGQRAHHIAEGALGCGMRDSGVQWYADKDATLAALRSLLRSGDYVLIKGSRGMRMETLVSALAASAQVRDEDVA